MVSYAFYRVHTTGYPNAKKSRFRPIVILLPLLTSIPRSKRFYTYVEVFLRYIKTKSTVHSSRLIRLQLKLLYLQSDNGIEIL